MKVLMSLLVVLFSVSMVEGREAEPPGRLSPDSPLLEEAAFADALYDACDLGYFMRARVFAAVDGADVSWFVSWNKDIHPDWGAATREAVNDELLSVTRRHAGDLEIDADWTTRVTTTFYERPTADDGSSETAKFRGGVCTYDAAEHGFQRTTARNFVGDVPDQQWMVTIVPRKRVWRKWEEIDGMLIIRNSGRMPMQIESPIWPDAELRNCDGSDVVEAPPTMYICYNWWNYVPHPVVEPGEVYIRGFSIETNPRESAGASLADNGRYQLVVPDSHSEVALVSEPVEVDVHTWPDQEVSPRIISFAACAARLVVLRDNGDFEAYDVATGDCIARWSVQTNCPLTGWNECLRVSPDGQWVGLSGDWRLWDESARASVLKQFHLSADGASPRHVPWPPSEEFARWRISGYTPDSRGLIVYNGKSRVTLDVNTGEVLEREEVTSKRSVTGDGRFEVDWTDDTIRFKPVDHGEPELVVSPEGEKAFNVVHAGWSGIYATEYQKPGVTYYGSDGRVVRLATGANIFGFIGEGPRGGVVALWEAIEWGLLDKAPLAVWQLDPPKMLWRLDDEKFRDFVLVENASLLVSGIRPESLFDDRAFSDTFEVYDLSTGRLLTTLETPYIETEGNGGNGKRP